MDFHSIIRQFQDFQVIDKGDKNHQLSKVIHYFTDQRTSYKFIVPKAPWWKCEVMSEGRSIEELATLLIEFESVTICV